MSTAPGITKRKATHPLTEAPPSKKVTPAPPKSTVHTTTTAPNTFTASSSSSSNNISMMASNSLMDRKVITIDASTGRISLGAASGVEPLVWFIVLFPMLGWKEIYAMRRTSSFFLNHWLAFLDKNRIQLPQDVKTFAVAGALMRTMCQEKTYTIRQPLSVELGQGVYVITSSWTSTFSGSTYKQTMLLPQNNIVITGKGADKTTVRGGFVVENISGILFEGLNVTSPYGMGLYMKGESANAVANDCTFSHSAICGLYCTTGAHVEMNRCQFAWSVKTGAFGMDQGTCLTLTDCTYHHNNDEGLFMYGSAVANVYGNKTQSHSNKSNGISVSEMGVVIVHLSESHNTSHDNANHDMILNDPLVGETPGTISRCSLCDHCVKRTHGLDSKIWEQVLFPMLGWKNIYKMRRTSKFILQHWKRFVKSNQIRIPQDVRTLSRAKELINTLYQEQTYTSEVPLVVELGPGVHEITTTWTSSSSSSDQQFQLGQTMSLPQNHLTIIGAGFDKTTIRGGLIIDNKRGITLQNLNVTSPSGAGLYLTGPNSFAYTTDCTFTHCQTSGISCAAGARVVTTRCQFSFNVQMGCFGMGQSTSIMATDCIFCYNNQKGLFVCRSAVANVYGDRTESFSNKIGLSAIEGGSIYLHLTELNQHQTSYFHNNRVVDKESKDTSISETSGLIQFCCLCHYCIQRRKY